MNTKNVTIKICVTAMFAALIVGGKTVLASIPNVEVVTILVALCGYCWGLSVVLPAVFVFIACDVMFYGFNTWVISYLIHWNVVGVCFWLLSLLKLNHPALKAVCATMLATVITALFGVTTSVVDTCLGFVTGKGFYLYLDDFWRRFCVLYLNGVVFYVTQVICNLFLFAVAFVPLERVNTRAKLRFLQQDVVAEE